MQCAAAELGLKRGDFTTKTFMELIRESNALGGFGPFGGKGQGGKGEAGAAADGKASERDMRRNSSMIEMRDYLVRVAEASGDGLGSGEGGMAGAGALLNAHDLEIAKMNAELKKMNALLSSHLRYDTYRHFGTVVASTLCSITALSIFTLSRTSK